MKFYEWEGEKNTQNPSQEASVQLCECMKVLMAY